MSVFFDYEKISQTVFYLINKYNHQLNYTKLLKLLYFADKMAILQTNKSITGDSYVCMKRGPVLSKTYDLIRKRSSDLIAQSFWSSRFDINGTELLCLNDRMSFDKLSKKEKQILDEIDEKYHKYTYSEMIELTHDPNICPEWKDPGCTSIPINYEDILLSIYKDDSIVEDLLEEQRAYTREEELIRSL